MSIWRICVVKTCVVEIAWTYSLPPKIASYQWISSVCAIWVLGGKEQVHYEGWFKHYALTMRTWGAEMNWCILVPFPWTFSSHFPEHFSQNCFCCFPLYVCLPQAPVNPSVITLRKMGLDRMQTTEAPRGAPASRIFPPAVAHVTHCLHVVCSPPQILLGLLLNVFFALP